MAAVIECWLCGEQAEQGRARCWQCQGEVDNRDVSDLDFLPVAQPEIVMNFERESRYRHLHHAIDGRELSTTRPFYFIASAKPHGRSSWPNGKAQTVHCIYCKKQLHSLRAVPAGKRRAASKSFPAELDKIQNEHTYPCAESWWWQTMCKFATKSLDAVNEGRVWAWLLKVREASEKYQGRGNYNVRDPWHPSRIDVAIVKQLEALPMQTTDPRVAELEVNFFHAITTVFSPNRPHWKEFVHGSETHPHLFNKIPTDVYLLDETVLEAAVSRGLTAHNIGRCGCGEYGPRGREAVDIPTYRYQP